MWAYPTHARLYLCLVFKFQLTMNDNSYTLQCAPVRSTLNIIMEHREMHLINK